jgi:hypothetical protein
MPRRVPTRWGKLRRPYLKVVSLFCTAFFSRQLEQPSAGGLIIQPAAICGFGYRGNEACQRLRLLAVVRRRQVLVPQPRPGDAEQGIPLVARLGLTRAAHAERESHGAPPVRSYPRIGAKNGGLRR